MKGQAPVPRCLPFATRTFHTFPLEFLNKFKYRSYKIILRLRFEDLAIRFSVVLSISLIYVRITVSWNNILRSVADIFIRTFLTGKKFFLPQSAAVKRLSSIFYNVKLAYFFIIMFSVNGTERDNTISHSLFIQFPKWRRIVILFILINELKHSLGWSFLFEI